MTEEERKEMIKRRKEMRKEMRKERKIGITERGDAGINLLWTQTIETVDGAVLISKNWTEEFKNAVLACHKPLVLHCTCTGYGGSALEPCVPDYRKQLDAMKDLIDRGFNPNNIVLRIDPIFPSEKGLKKIKEVLNYFGSLNTEVSRIRISIVDEYIHVKERYRQHGWQPLYEGFSPSNQQVQMVADTLNEYPYTYEMCAENYLATKLQNAKVIGCISTFDLELMGIIFNEYMYQNPQYRSGCHCLSCKTELLTERKQCPNGCVYCFWK